MAEGVDREMFQLRQDTGVGVLGPAESTVQTWPLLVSAGKIHDPSTCPRRISGIDWVRWERGMRRRALSVLRRRQREGAALLQNLSCAPGEGAHGRAPDRIRQADNVRSRNAGRNGKGACRLGAPPSGSSAMEAPLTRTIARRLE
jgi:hypothetical protein